MTARRGGRRPGAGRPRGTGTGRTVKPVMFHLSPAIIEAIDACRGGQSRSEWVTAAIASLATPMQWPASIDIAGAVHYATGKIGCRSGTSIPCAEYDCYGARVWLDALGVVHPE